MSFSSPSHINKACQPTGIDVGQGRAGLKRQAALKDVARVAVPAKKSGFKLCASCHGNMMAYSKGSESKLACRQALLAHFKRLSTLQPME